MVVLKLCHICTIKEPSLYKSATDPGKFTKNTPLHTCNGAYGQTYSPHMHVQTQRQTYKHAVNEARLSSVMTPVLAWQDVYTHNHGRASDVGRDESEMRREEKEEAETWRWASVMDCFSLFDRRTVVTVPHWELRERQRETRIDRQQRGREMYLEGKGKTFFFLLLLWTQPHSRIRRKTIRSTRFPLSRSVDYKWANLAFITSLQTFIKAGTPLKLQR